MTNTTPGDPNVSSDTSELLDQIVVDIVSRLEAGETVDLDFLVAEHSGLRERLEELLPTLTAMVDLGDAVKADTPGEPPRGDHSIETLSLDTSDALGDYRLIREIGRGGMGVVYEAEQISLRRRVALKTLPLAGALDARCLQRFRNEAMAAAQLEHPHIVNVYGVGCERGVHYYAMRFIDGRTLADLVLERRNAARANPSNLSAKHARVGTRGELPAIQDREWEYSIDATLPNSDQVGRVREPSGDGAAFADTAPIAAARTQLSHTSGGWFQRVAHIGICVAEGLHYAHDCGISHRDIKPSNLLVDSEGKIWITDFGLAQIEAEPALTGTRDIVGTLRYMSPEQAAGKRCDLNHLTDVYSLGVTMYELLTLKTPFDGPDAATVLRQLADAEPRPVRALNPAVPIDLETIVMKAIAKSPAERYSTAQHLADDLRRFEENRPILARKAGPVLRAQKWVRRHPAVMATSLAVVVLLLAGFAANNVLVANALGVAEMRHAEAVQQKERANRHLYLAHVRLANQDWQSGQIRRMRSLLDLHVPAEGEADRRGWEWHYLDGLCHSSLATYAGHTDKVFALSVSPDGTQMATASADHKVKIWDVESERELRTLYGHESRVFSVAWSPRGDRVASGDRLGRVLVWNVNTGEVVRQLNFPKLIFSLAWSPDGSKLCAGNSAGQVRVWEADSGQTVYNLVGKVGTRQLGMIRSVAWSPNGERIAVGENYLGHVQIWNARTGELEESIDAHHHYVSSVAWSPDSLRLATISVDQSLIVWDSTSWEKLVAIKPVHGGQALAVAWNTDGNTLVSGGDDGIVKLWDASTGELQLERRGHVGSVHAVAWHPHDGRLFSASADGTAKLWSADGHQEFKDLRGHGGLAWSPDGALMAVRPPLLDETEVAIDNAAERTCLEVIDPYTQRRVFKLVGADPSISGVDWNQSGDIAAGGSDGSVFVWNTTNGNQTAQLRGHTSRVRSVAWSPDNELLATGGTDNKVILWDVSRHEPVRTLSGHRHPISSVDWSPDGNWLVSADWFQNVKVWEATTGREKINMRLHAFEADGAGGQNSVAWSPDGQLIAAGSCEGVIVVWDANTGREVQVMRGHVANVRAVAWHPDGTRLVSGSLDRTVRVWNVDTGEELLVFSGEAEVSCVGWSPDGRSVAAAGEGSARMWDATPNYLTFRAEATK
jgi:WD40 repeat protein/serine/threonine protein kinase